MLRQLSSRLSFKALNNKRIILNKTFTVLHHQRLESSGVFVNSSQSKFRHVGIEKDAGALQDLLRRVMEIDADITKTPIAKFEPNASIPLIEKHETPTGIREAKETAEYTIDEDEATDMKGDIMILNPYFPSIELSKIAFSYGLGRAAKLNSIERCIEDYLSDISSIPGDLCNADYKDGKWSNRLLIGKLMFIQQRMIKGSRDGLLGTTDFHWAKPELEGYVNKISDKFDVVARIAILNKQIEYAKNAVYAAKEHGLLQ
ncbi:hypothetical protein [Parasitella parasitica]|uniref:DUF155 domain-containing protein n=1 Tax=Parasitella parasitica TaxID=35722 RepID=A0A0B7NVJ0_9FUNG|nr:hypothetical protein [Parasitella parasitica]